MVYSICWLGLHDYTKTDGVWRCQCGKKKLVSPGFYTPMDIPPPPKPNAKREAE